jgi:hypothetical protein
MTNGPAMSLNARCEPIYRHPSSVTSMPLRRIAVNGFLVFGFMVPKCWLNGLALSRERAQNGRPTMEKPSIVPIKVGMNEAMRRPMVAASEPVAWSGRSRKRGRRCQ